MQYSILRGGIDRSKCHTAQHPIIEWKKLVTGNPRRSKAALCDWQVDDEPFAVAAIWDRWRKGSDVLYSFAVMTIFPDELMATIHDRMPVIIDPKDYYRWPEPGNPERPLLDLLRRAMR